MNILKNNKNLITIGIVGLIGILIGIVFSINLNIPAAKSTAEPTIASNSDVATNLSRSFVKVAKAVTPSIVSITSTKIIKNQRKNFFNPFDFFGNPGDDSLKNFQTPDTPEQYKTQALGSGVIVKDDGTILTNNHVISGASEIKVYLSDKRTSFPAKLIGTDPKTDVAVIKITKKAENLKPATLGNSDKLEVGEWVLAIGSPFGLSSTVTAGIVSAEGRGNVGVADFEDFIQTDAAINPGNSGGALINLAGEVIGINTAIASKTGGYMGLGFAIPINMAKKVMDALITKGKVTRGYLGIIIQDLSEEFAKNLDIKDSTYGIVVGQVTKDSPAEKAGVKPYDVIIKLNGQNVKDINQFRNTVATTAPGTEVSLGIIRDKNTIEIKVPLGELKNDDTQPANQQEEDNTKTLGFTVKEITPDIAEQLNLPHSTQGCIVVSIDPGSTAMEAGLRQGDIIKEVNRSPVKSFKDFKALTNKIKKGQSLMLQIQRNDANILLAFTIE